VAASVRSWDAENGAENVTSVTLTDPDSGTSGDQVLYWVFRQGVGTGGSGDAPSTPSGLTKRFDNIGTHGTRYAYSKHMEGYDLYDCDASDQSETFTATVAVDRAGVLARIAGVDSSTVQYHQTTAGNVANNGTLSAWKLPNGTTDSINYVDGAITVIVVAFYDGNSDDQDVTIDDFTLDATTADMEVTDGTTLRLFHRVWSGSGTSNPIIRNGTGGNIAPVALAWTFEASSAASQNIDGTAIASAETHGGGAIAIGVVNITGTAIGSAEAHGTGEVIGPIDMVGTAIASAEAHGTGAVSGGVIDLGGTAIVSAEVHGTGTVTGGEGAQFEVGNGYIGDHGPDQDLSGTAIATAEAHGTSGVVTGGSLNIAGQAITTAEAHGTGAVAVGSLNIGGAAIAGAEAHGTGTVNPGAIGLTGTAIGTAEAHGTGEVTLTSSLQNVDGQALASSEAHGTGAIAIGAVNVTGTAVASAEAHGTGTVTLGTTIVGTGLASGEAHGTGAVSIGDALLAGQAIASAEAHGTGAIATGTTTVGGQAIASAETFGLGQIVLGALIIGAAIATGEAHGTGAVAIGAPPARRIRRSARRPDMSQSAREEGDN
jgi:hypothetical protein